MPSSVKSGRLCEGGGNFFAIFCLRSSRDLQHIPFLRLGSDLNQSQWSFFGSLPVDEMRVGCNIRKLYLKVTRKPSTAEVLLIHIVFLIFSKSFIKSFFLSPISDIQRTQMNDL